MAFPKGRPRPAGAGRKKGVPNKITSDAKLAWEEAIAHAQGKMGYSMKDWATRDHESNQKFWLATIAKLPQSITLNVDLSTLSDEALEAIAAGKPPA